MEPTRRCRADDLNIDSWASFLLNQLLSKPDGTTGARLLNGRPIEASDQRALYRWFTERNRPSFWRADKFLIRYGAHIDEFFLYCQERGLQPWASGQSPGPSLVMSQVDADELLYGRSAVSSRSSRQLYWRVQRARRAEKAARFARIRHQGVNEYGGRVVFWTEPCDPGISFEVAVAWGLLHRRDGPAAIHELPNGGEVRTYYQRGSRHREDGPAIEGRPHQPDEYWWHGSLTRRMNQD